MLYQLYIVGCKGVKTLVDVANSEEEFRNTTVEELKRIILKYDDFREADLNMENLRLLYVRRPLGDRDTLGEHVIRHRDTIYVIVYLPGGGVPPEDEDKGIPRTASMDRLASMQQTEPEPNTSCLIL